MIQVLRFIGIMNAAVWLGAAVFFTFAAGPAFFSNEAKGLGLHQFWLGAMAQLIISRLFYFNFICCVIAIAHQLAEWVYLGRPLQRLTIGLLMGIMCLGLVGGVWLQPKLKRLNLVKYGMNEQYKPAGYSTVERVEAARAFGVWHGVARAIDLVALGGLIIYFWRVVHPNDDLRFVSATTPKFRG